MKHESSARKDTQPKTSAEDREKFHEYATHFGDDDNIRPVTPTRPPAAPITASTPQPNVMPESAMPLTGLGGYGAFYRTLFTAIAAEQRNVLAGLLATVTVRGEGSNGL